jgi:hypothetical protein
MVRRRDSRAILYFSAGSLSPTGVRVYLLTFTQPVRLMFHPRDWVFCTKSFANSLQILGLPFFLVYDFSIQLVLLQLI